jgi:hypothetical protein
MVVSAIIVTLLVQAAPTVDAAPGVPTPDERVLRQVAELGAVVRVMAFSEGREIHVSFPSGELVRERRRNKEEPLECGIGVERQFEPPDSGPPMTDCELALLAAVPHLTWLDLTGSQVTAQGVASLRRRLRKVKIVWDHSSR